VTSGDAFAEFERAGWDSGRASPYHRGLGAMTSRPIPALLDAAAVGLGSAVLDVATGPGYAAALAAERGAEVVAVDLSREMLDLAAKLHPEIEFRQADANALPFEAARFDAVVSNLLMPHVTDLPAVVHEFARLVRPGGRVALSTWDPEPPTYLKAIFEEFVASGAAPPPDLPPGPSFFQYGAEEEFRALLIEAGLDDPVVESVRFTYRIEDADCFIADLIAGTVRMGIMLEAQPADVQARFREGFAQRVEEWRYELPCAIKVGAATR
jgi:ubiquinone/menaquinone biosynthesis C-methylase UbiE